MSLTTDDINWLFVILIVNNQYIAKIYNSRNSYAYILVLTK